MIRKDEEGIKEVYGKYFSKLLGKEQRCEGKHGEEIEENVERIVKSMETIANLKTSKPIDGQTNNWTAEAKQKWRQRRMESWRRWVEKKW